MRIESIEINQASEQALHMVVEQSRISQPLKKNSQTLYFRQSPQCQQMAGIADILIYPDICAFTLASAMIAIHLETR